MWKLLSKQIVLNSLSLFSVFSIFYSILLVVLKILDHELLPLVGLDLRSQSVAQAGPYSGPSAMASRVHKEHLPWLLRQECVCVHTDV